MFATRPPRPPIVAQFVSSYWYCQLDVDHDTEVVFPSARSQIVIGLHPTSTDLSVLVWPSTKATPIDATQQRRAVGVNLRVGSASFLCRENAKNLVDYEVDLETLWGLKAASLTDRLRNADSPEQLFNELDTFLLCRLDVDRQLDPDVVAAEEAIRLGVPAGRVPKLLRVDRRRLARSFGETVGLGLKSYGRLCRFGDAVSVLRQPSAESFSAESLSTKSLSTKSLSTVAASLGYADQAHLTREVKEFSGMTPGVLRSHPSSSPNHFVSTASSI